MKRYLLLLLCCNNLLLKAQPGFWEQKSSLGWNAIVEPTSRYASVAFTIGNKGYIGTGTSSFSTQDLWEYDPGTDSWTQKANLGGSDRENAVGFVIGDKGYIGLGDRPGPRPLTGTVLNDLWEYDPAANAWTQKADFPTEGRAGAAAFAIAGKGYVGTGEVVHGSGQILLNDFWEYDPVADHWTQKAAFAGTARESAVGFTIGDKGYLGTGDDMAPPFGKQDFWEYDPVADHWTRKADFGGGIRTRATGVAIGNKAYVGLGLISYMTSTNDLWEYDPVADSWTRRTDFTGSPRNGAAGFSIGGDAYFVSGFDGQVGIPLTGVPGNRMNDCWKYDTLADSWAPKASFGAGGRSNAIGFVIGGKGYLGMGMGANGNSAYLTDFWEYDTLTNSWSQKASFPAGSRVGPVGFSLANKGYVGLGRGLYGADIWEFDPVLNTWTQKADFPGGVRTYAVGLSIGSIGYVGLGSLHDFWAYDPSADTWTRRADFPGSAISQDVGFSIGDKGYIGLGIGVSSRPDSTLWEYDPAGDTWTQKQSKFPGAAGGYPAIAFSIGNYGYASASSPASTDAFYQYDPTADTWTWETSNPSVRRIGMVGFSIGQKGYMGTGSGTTEFFQYSTQSPLFTTPGDYNVLPYCPTLSGTGFQWQIDAGHLISGINPNNNNLGTTCWSIRIAPAGAYANRFGWFGGTQQSFGAYLPRNFVITPTGEPDSAVTLRLYYTAAELTDFIKTFNTTYGTTYTQNDIRVIRYDGANQDLDPGNNSDIAADYTAITPTAIGPYGQSDTCRYVEFSTNHLSEFYLALSSFTGPLALNLLNFTAAYDHGVTQLQWQTAQETNTSYFAVQRSTDGAQFSTIASVPAADNATSVRNYSYDDLTAAAAGVKTLYYRLAETGLDSQRVYSKVTSVTVSSTRAGLAIYPVPAHDAIRVELNSPTAAGTALLAISDLTGRRLAAFNIALAEGDNSFPLSISYLPAGEYIIAVTTNNAHWQTKFIKE